MMLLNRLLEKIVPCITNLGGAIGKYHSEGFTGYFGLLKKPEEGDNEKASVEAAVNIRKALMLVNKERKKSHESGGPKFVPILLSVRWARLCLTVIY